MPAHKPLSNTSQAALVGLALLLPPIDSTALEWSAQPSISVASDVTDNINLVPTPSGTIWSSTISPQLILSAKSPQSELNGTAQINRIDYSDKSLFSRTDGLLNLTFSRQLERSQLSFAGDVTRDSTLESELIQTGVVTSRAQRTSRSLSPSWNYYITQRDAINLGYSYLDVTYDKKTATSGLLDYIEKDPNITLTHAFSEKNKLNLSLGYSDYKSLTPISVTTRQYHSTTTSTQLGFSRDFSETLSVSLMAGVHKTDSRINSLDCLPFFPPCFPVPVETNFSNTGSLFAATLNKAFESSQLTAGLSRSLQASGNGGLIQTDRLSGSYSAKLAPTLSGSLNMSIYQSQSSTASSNSNSSRYYIIVPAMSWQITEWWSANTSYSRSLSRDANGTEATANAINLTLHYNWPKISKSR